MYVYARAAAVGNESWPHEHFPGLPDLYARVTGAAQRAAIATYHCMRAKWRGGNRDVARLVAELVWASRGPRADHWLALDEARDEERLLVAQTFFFI
jgi:hypothetical protein